MRLKPVKHCKVTRNQLEVNSPKIKRVTLTANADERRNTITKLQFSPIAAKARSDFPVAGRKIPI